MSIDVRHCSIDGKDIFISSIPPVVYCMGHEIGTSINGQWLPIPHPGDSGGRGTSGDTGQGG